MNVRRVLDSNKCSVYAWAPRRFDLLALVSMIAIAAPLAAEEQSHDSRPKLVAVQDDALRRELLSMTEEDQKARMEMMRELADAGTPIGSHIDTHDPTYVATMKKVSTKLAVVDGKNRAQLKEIVELHGWPSISLVGKDGAQAAWMLVQHADADREFQKACLALMGALPDGEIDKQAVAYLTVRVLVGEKKPQRYGTQMDGEFKPAPLEDPENVDRRRAEVGLPPLAEYIKMSKEMYEKMSAGSPKMQEISRE